MSRTLTVGEFYRADLYDDTVFRVNEDEEFELYAGNGKWEVKPRLAFEYSFGFENNYSLVNEEKAQEIMKNRDLGER